MLIYTGVRGVLVAYYSGVDWAPLYKGEAAAQTESRPRTAHRPARLHNLCPIQVNFVALHILSRLYSGENYIQFYPWESEIYTTNYVLSSQYVLAARHTCNNVGNQRAEIEKRICL